MMMVGKARGHGDLFDLFSVGARNTDPETSHLAAARNPHSRTIDREKVLAAHADNPDGLTDFELAEIVDRQQTSAGKRRGELRDAGLIEETDMRRAAPSGSLAIVWRITASGVETLEQWRMV